MIERHITALRMERQHLTRKANEAEYIGLYRDTQPGQNVYWNGFADPLSLTYRADFNDIEFNRERQRKHNLIKGRIICAVKTIQLRGIWGREYCENGIYGIFDGHYGGRGFLLQSVWRNIKELLQGLRRR